MTGSNDNTRSPFEPGVTCWRYVRSPRTAVLIDGVEYFAAVADALAQARHSVLIVGWEINTETPLVPGPGPEVPREQRLGRLLSNLTAARPDLAIHILGWDAPPLYGRERQSLVNLRFALLAPRRLHFAFDRAHPLGASHHQKVVVIDDALAFVGGLDLTLGRADTPDHRPDDPRRTNPDGSTYGPFHDAMVAVTGDAAAALGALVRQRWQWATGRPLPAPPPRGDDVWPQTVEPDFCDHSLAIARTFPAWQERPEIREIEKLYVAEIRSARHTIYMENQYFTAARVAAVLARLLRRPDGPEIVLVMPRDPTGWLEKTSMMSRREALLARLRARDRFDRLRVYHPVVGAAQDCAVKVHTKLMIVDERIAHIGSANLNNRSMGLDSECDIAWRGDPETATAAHIAALRNRLLAEHLGRTPAQVAAAVRDHNGSMISAIESLRGPGRSLVPHTPQPADDPIAERIDEDLLDPGAPNRFERVADRLVWSDDKEGGLRKNLISLAVTILVLSAIAVAWRWGPLADAFDVADLGPLAQTFRSPIVSFAVGLVAYVIGALLMVPIVALIFGAGFLYGPLAGFALALPGSLLATALGYLVGRAIGKPVLARLSGPRLDRLNRALARRGIMATIIVRMLPLAPFAFVNMAAGASHIGFRDFIVGTALGMVPGITILTLLSGQLERTTASPDLINLTALLGLVVLLILLAGWLWRRFARRVHG